MKLQEIKDAVDAGKTVHWCNPAYKVIRTGGFYAIKCMVNSAIVGLTGQDETTMNGEEHEFYIAE